MPVENDAPWTGDAIDSIDPNHPLKPAEAKLVAKHKPIIAKAITRLEASLKEFSAALGEAPFAVVFEPVLGKDKRIKSYRRLEHGPSIEAAATAYATIELRMEDPVNTPVRCHGAVGVEDLVTLQLAKEVNRLKTVLKAKFKPLTNARFFTTVRVRGQRVNKKIPLSLYILRQLQKSSLNRLGAYRQIPLLRHEGKGRPPTPVAIGFTEAWSQSVVRRSISELLAEREAAGRFDEVEQLNRSGIPGNEYVYGPKKHYLRMRANVWLPGAGEPTKHPENYMAEMPILFWRRASMAWPKVTPPRPREKDGDPRGRLKIPLDKKEILGSHGFVRRLRPEDREFASK